MTFLFVGGGARFPELAREAAKRHANNVHFRDYVHEEPDPRRPRGSGLHADLPGRPLAGDLSPSKINSSLAMGLPVLYAGPDGPNVDQAIAEYDCGFSLRQGDVAGLT